MTVHLSCLLAAATLPLVACGPQSDTEAAMSPMSTDSAGIDIVTSHPMNSDATCAIGEEPTVVIGGEENDEAGWFASLRDAGTMSDGSFVALDQIDAQFRIHDSAGEHLRTVGRHGEGPGEFESPYQIWVGAASPRTGTSAPAGTPAAASISRTLTTASRFGD